MPAPTQAPIPSQHKQAGGQYGLAIGSGSHTSSRFDHSYVDLSHSHHGFERVARSLLLRLGYRAFIADQFQIKIKTARNASMYVPQNSSTLFMAPSFCPRLMTHIITLSIC